MPISITQTQGIFVVLSAAFLLAVLVLTIRRLGQTSEHPTGRSGYRVFFYCLIAVSGLYSYLVFPAYYQHKVAAAALELATADDKNKFITARNFLKDDDEISKNKKLMKTLATSALAKSAMSNLEFISAIASLHPRAVATPLVYGGIFSTLLSTELDGDSVYLRGTSSLNARADLFGLLSVKFGDFPDRMYLMSLKRVGEVRDELQAESANSKVPGVGGILEAIANADPAPTTKKEVRSCPVDLGNVDMDKLEKAFAVVKAAGFNDTGKPTMEQYRSYIDLVRTKSLPKLPAVLCIAARTQNLEAVKLLIADGANVNERCTTLAYKGEVESRQVALHHAVTFYSLDVAKELVSAGADVNIVDSRCETALDIVEDTSVIAFGANKENRKPLRDFLISVGGKNGRAIGH